MVDQDDSFIAIPFACHSPEAELGAYPDSGRHVSGSFPVSALPGVTLRMGLTHTKAVNPVQWTNEAHGGNKFAFSSCLARRAPLEGVRNEIRVVVMGKVKLILGLFVLAFAIIAGWQIASCELANLAFHEDLRDLAAQTGAYIGLFSFNSDEDFRNAVVRAAKGHDIQLEAEQVTVERTGTAQVPIIYLAADYKARVTLPGGSFTLHFHTSSAK